MEQTTINQRLKFLLKAFSLSARAFSEKIGESPTNTQNYVGTRGAEPRASYIQNVLRHFKSINAQWLLLGEGEPFLSDKDALDQSATTNVKKNSGNIQNNTGNAQVTNNIELAECKRDLDATRRDAAAYQREIALLQGQLKDKEEIITLLRASYNRPN